MATTKKARTRKAAPSEPVPANDGPEATAPKVVVPRKVRRRRTFHVHLLEGASYSVRGLDLVAARPLITSDERIYEALRRNGRLRIDVREGGA